MELSISDDAAIPLLSKPAVDTTGMGIPSTKMIDTNINKMAPMNCVTLRYKKSEEEKRF